ncbi:MAG: SAM-dependent methyltransferase [Thermoproteota archaeon]
MERVVGNAIEHGHVDLENPQVIVNVEILFNRAYVSILKAGEIISKRIGVERKWEKGKRPINRSELKMIEILQLRPEIASCKIALDLGAALGGWTKVLSRQVEKVYSVDPAKLNEDVLDNVIHLKKKLEELTVEDIPERVDLITCDANISAQELSPLIGGVVEHFLSENGLLVLTLKAVTRNGQRRTNRVCQSSGQKAPNHTCCHSRYSQSATQYQKRVNMHLQEAVIYSKLIGYQLFDSTFHLVL